jgi:hypothetical protein
VATITTNEINISKIDLNDLKTKTNRSYVKSSSIDEILDSLTDSRGNIQWLDLIESLQVHFPGMSRTQAAIEVRYLINISKLYLVPCHLAASAVVFSLEPIAVPEVYWTEEDEKLYRKQNLDYVNELSRTVQQNNHHQVKERNERNRGGGGK